MSFILWSSFSPFSAIYNTVCPNIVTVPKVGKQSASSYWHIFIRFFHASRTQITWSRFQYCANIFFLMCFLHFPSNFPSGITWVNTVLIATSLRDGAYLSLWKCRECTISWVGILLVAGELSDCMPKTYSAVFHEDHVLGITSCVSYNQVSALIVSCRG